MESAIVNKECSSLLLASSTVSEMDLCMVTTDCSVMEKSEDNLLKTKWLMHDKSKHLPFKETTLQFTEEEVKDKRCDVCLDIFLGNLEYSKHKCLKDDMFENSKPLCDVSEDCAKLNNHKLTKKGNCVNGKESEGSITNDVTVEFLNRDEKINNVNRTLIRYNDNNFGDDNEYKCKFCEKTFSCNTTLLDHINSHEDKEKSYVCTFCKQSLSNGSNLKAHLLIHTSEKKFTCCFCQKSFSLNSSLEVHLSVHTGEKKLTNNL
ncbi:uncharacterized protein LOC142333754 [Lycorma delicatula]|uniref:uncharacterized protein LOC142333754 n=1 Tax=Lycorma delicatula TaxID=130591 RepID=UPI003F50F751